MVTRTVSSRSSGSQPQSSGGLGVATVAMVAAVAAMAADDLKLESRLTRLGRQLRPVVAMATDLKLESQLARLGHQLSPRSRGDSLPTFEAGIVQSDGLFREAAGGSASPMTRLERCATCIIIAGMRRRQSARHRSP